MKLYSVVFERAGYTYASDMGTVDFLRWCRNNLGHVALTFEMEIGPTEYQRWQAEGGQVASRNQLRV